ncbi:MAG: hypothetical protein HUJ54_02475 [Erysipelotrichaceae bacterium]|nr:hypothetical protein [Erysipelotrichaceae bacterium]
MKKLTKLLLACMLMIPFAVPGSVHAEENGPTVIELEVPGYLGRETRSADETFKTKLWSNYVEDMKYSATDLIYKLLSSAVHSDLPCDHIYANADFSKIRVFVDSDQFVPDDNASFYGLAKLCAYYQCLLQTPVNRIKAEMEFVTWKGGKTLSTINLIEFMNNHPEFSDFHLLTFVPV